MYIVDEWKNQESIENPVSQNCYLKSHRCSKAFKSFYRWKSHLNSNKQNNILERHLTKYKRKSKFWCLTCIKPFVRLEQHQIVTEHAKMKNKICRHCGNIEFKTEEEFLWHIKDKHDGKLTDYYMCSDCGKQYKTKSELTHHIISKCGTIKRFKCQVCNQELMTSGSLHNHMLRHNGERSYMCRYCAKQFLTAGQLKVHERIHTQEKAFVCNVCGKGFCHRQSLITHSTIHTGIKPYQCENCGNSFSCVGNLIKHRRTHADTCGLIPLTTHRVKHPSTRVKVKINTPSNSRLKAHVKEKELEEKLAALKPNVTTINDNLIKQNAENSIDGRIENDTDLKINLEQNEFSGINNSSANEMTRIETGTTFEITNIKTECKIIEQESNDVHIIDETLSGENSCNNTIVPYFENEDLNTDSFISDESLHETVKFTADENLPATETISTNSKGATIIEVDIRSICKEVEQPVRRRRKVNITETDLTKNVEERGLINKQEMFCKYCNKPYTNVRWLLKHEKEHENNDIFNSDGENNLDTKSRQYKCNYCGSFFSSKIERKEHCHKIHADLLTCQECDKIFANIDSLRSHQNIFHKGLTRKVYLYICEKCGKQFKQKTNIIYHKENNCQMGPLFECHICLKKFSSIHTRRTHMRVHDPEKKLLCKFCGKSFNWKGQLKIHERSHTGEKPYTCLYCPKAFAYRESLLTHSSLHTGIKPHLCEACGSRFSCIGNLIKHRVTHASTCGTWYAKNADN